MKSVYISECIGHWMVTNSLPTVCFRGSVGWRLIVQEKSDMLFLICDSRLLLKSSCLPQLFSAGCAVTKAHSLVKMAILDSLRLTGSVVDNVSFLIPILSLASSQVLREQDEVDQSTKWVPPDTGSHQLLCFQVLHSWPVRPNWCEY